MLNIQDDTDVEGSETVELTLGNPVGATILGAHPGVLTITDNEPVFQFLAPRYAVAERASKATITVKRTGVLAGPATVDYQITGGTATAGTDYTAAASGTLSFGAGKPTQILAIIPVNDKVDEPAEAVTLALANPSGGYGIGTPGTTVLTINDNDVAGKAQFNAGSYSVAEDGDSARITVRAPCALPRCASAAPRPARRSSRISNVRPEEVDILRRAGTPEDALRVRRGGTVA